ncbi:MAG: hypothetical protein ACE5IZ_06600 [Dehalococcoidia bacterium]
MRSVAWVAGVLVLAAASVVAWRVGVGGLAGGSSPASVDAVAALPRGVKIVYREFGAATDTIWAALAEDPAQRVALAQVEHAAGWGIGASLAPDGGRLVYVAAADSSGTGQVWVMGLDGSDRRRLGEGADARIAPAWAPDGSAVAFVRDAGAGLSLVQVGMDGAETELVVGGALGLYPVGYSPDGGAFYYAQVTAAGTDFGAVSLDDGEVRLFARASDSIARDWRLSPDGERIVYLAPQVAYGRVHYRAFVVAMAGGDPVVLAAIETVAGDHFGPAWHPDGRDVTLGRAPAGDSAGAETVAAATGEVVQALAGPARGFDVPVAWSPNGRYLVVRSFDGDSARNPGRERDVVIGADGERRQIATEGDAEFIGWLAPGP